MEEHRFGHMGFGVWEMIDAHKADDGPTGTGTSSGSGLKLKTD